MARKTPTPAPLSVRDWVLCVLEERARRHAAEVSKTVNHGLQGSRPPEPPPTIENEGNLCACLVTFAAWRRCCVCGSLTLYVNGNAQSDGDVECGLCRRLREELAERLRQTSQAPRYCSAMLLTIASPYKTRGFRCGRVARCYSEKHRSRYNWAAIGQRPGIINTTGSQSA
jgi:hypothetical protein